MVARRLKLFFFCLSTFNFFCDLYYENTSLSLHIMVNVAAK